MSQGPTFSRSKEIWPDVGTLAPRGGRKREPEGWGPNQKHFLSVILGESQRTGSHNDTRKPNVYFLDGPYLSIEA